MTGVIGALAVGPRLAAARVLDKPPEAPGLAAFIEAGGVLRTAQSYADLRKATDLVARSAQQMGLDRFRPFLRGSDDHVRNTGGLVTLARDFAPMVPSPRVSPPVATPPTAVYPPLPPPGLLARTLGTLFQRVGWVSLAGWAISAIGQANLEVDLKATIERFGLDTGSPADMAAAVAYLQARVNRSVLLGTDLPASAQDAVAERVMQAVRADPGLWERATAGDADALAAVRAAVRKTPNPNPDKVPKLGFSYEARNDEERRLVHELMAQGKSGAEIAAALEGSRNRRTPTAEQRRNTPGMVTVSKPLEPAGEDWLRKGIDTPDGAPIPAQVAERLQGRKFATFKTFREAFWKEIEATPELAKGFNTANLARMRRGFAPFTILAEAMPGENGWQLHHEPALSKGGPVYELSSMRVVTPRQHRRLTKGNSK